MNLYFYLRAAIGEAVSYRLAHSPRLQWTYAYRTRLSVAES